MSFTTKKYTRPALLKELKKVPAGAFASLDMLAEAISPRAGTNSAKINSLARIFKSKRALRDVLYSTVDFRQVKRDVIVVLKKY